MLAKHWWQKLIDWFSDDPIDFQQKKQPGPHGTPRPGRIEEMKRDVHPRVVHHYPQNDNFPISLGVKRPHLRKTRSERNERPGRHASSAPEPSEMKYTPLRDRKDLFTGVNFKAEDIPSPVYGFQKRHKHAGHEEDLRKTEQPQPLDEEPAGKLDDPGIEVHTEKMDTTAEDVYKEETVREDIQSEQKQGKPRQNRAERRQAQRKEKTNEPLSTIPYNVLMFKRDQMESQKPEKHSRGNYGFPGLSLLAVPSRDPDDDQNWLREQQRRLEEALKHFNVNAKVVGLTKGPSVTRFEIQPAPGVKVNKVTKLSDDLKLSLAAKDIRIEAPIPGKNSIGIEIPNRASRPVVIREIIRSGAFGQNGSPLTAALGLDISGAPVVTDLQNMPHGLIAGATGSGKSVCINSILVSLLFKASPEEVKFLLIDPKVVELAPFQNIPHLATPVVTDPKEASLALKWAVEEMERRYEAFAEAGVRDIGRYNKKQGTAANKPAMPYIVIVIDELADLMMVSPQDVEESICRIAQKARACGIHLIVATQRPSVDVITGLIKANIPTRIAFSVSSQVDSRTILDTGGAEKLLGKGDMLFVENGSSKSVRIQGNFVSDEEIDRITDFIKKQGKPEFLFQKDDLVKKQTNTDSDDELFEEACYFVLDQGAASSSSLQRRFRIGYNRAARLIEMMEAKGMISEALGSKPRRVLITEEELEENVLKI
jgi:S-DNA-T family DNA segregation ATPase FtsK/SpoIIIE